MFWPGARSLAWLDERARGRLWRRRFMRLNPRGTSASDMVSRLSAEAKDTLLAWSARAGWSGLRRITRGVRAYGIEGETDCINQHLKPPDHHSKNTQLLWQWTQTNIVNHQSKKTTTNSYKTSQPLQKDNHKLRQKQVNHWKKTTTITDKTSQELEKENHNNTQKKTKTL